jgi:transposase
MIGCDLHDKTMLLKIAEGRSKPTVCSVKNTVAGRAAMIQDLKRMAAKAGKARLLFAYEASGQGFGLYDQLTDAGIECFVLAPTKIARSQRQKSQKTDEKDAQQLLELLRGHVLAGNDLPTVWIPDVTTRDDRELVRMRIDVAEKRTIVKTQIQCLLKRNYLKRPKELGVGWNKRFWTWLKVNLSESPESPLKLRCRLALASLLRQLVSLEEEIEVLDKQVSQLAKEPRYEAAFEELCMLTGVATTTAIVFLTEMGDLSRFQNRRQLAAYLGLVPSSSESGEANDRKGHITRQGSPRVRKMLCQATWSRVRNNKEEKAAYRRIVARNPKKKKIAVVASMRRLAIRMWHQAKEVQGKPSRSSILLQEAKAQTESRASSGGCPA